MAKAKDASATQGGANITEIKKQGLKLAEQYIKAKKERTLVNEKMGQIRAAAEELGIPKKAFTDAIKYKELDIDKREGYDEGYMLMRETLGVPVEAEQLDMFDDPDGGGEGGGGKVAGATDAEWDAANPAAETVAAAEQHDGAVLLDDGIASVKETAAKKTSKKPAPAVILN
jgi:hypothetical protein